MYNTRFAGDRGRSPLQYCTRFAGDRGWSPLQYYTRFAAYRPRSPLQFFRRISQSPVNEIYCTTFIIKIIPPRGLSIKNLTV